MAKEGLAELIANMKEEVIEGGLDSSFAMQRLETLNASEAFKEIFDVLHERIKYLEKELIEKIDRDLGTVGVGSPSKPPKREEIGEIRKNVGIMNELVNAMGRIASRTKEEKAIKPIKDIGRMDFSRIKMTYGLPKHPGEVARETLKNITL